MRHKLFIVGNFTNNVGVINNIFTYFINDIYVFRAI